MALEEREKWRRREKEILGKLKKIRRKKKKLENEAKKIKENIKQIEDVLRSAKRDEMSKVRITDRFDEHIIR